MNSPMPVVFKMLMTFVNVLKSLFTILLFFKKFFNCKISNIFPSNPLQVVGILGMQLLLQFYSYSFETLQVMVWRYVHCVGIIILFCHFFHKMNLVVIFPAVMHILGIFCMQLLLQFYADSFETLQVYRQWSEDVHIVWI